MSPALDGSRLKVIRAQEHVDSLKTEIAMYLNERPYKIKAKIADESDTNVLLVTQPALRLSTIIGDCVGNCRAALDYILWELVSKYFDPPFDVTDFNDRRITAFPLTTDPSDTGYVDRTNRLAKRKIPAAAITEIHRSQPCHAGNEPLGWLHHLSNNDKHRMPVLTIAYAPIFAYITDGEGNVSPAVYSLDGHALPTAEQIAAMKMEHYVSLHVTIQDVLMPREPVDRTLEQIVKAVADVIPRFDLFFA